MPWQTPNLQQVRSLVRDAIHGSLPGSDATVPNSVLRVLSDCQGALCFLTLEYIDWLALQLLPDTAETEWLDRHGQIWLVNADGTIGRKQATLAKGSVAITGQQGVIIPLFSLLGGVGAAHATYQTLEQVVLGTGPTTAPVSALDPGADSNLDPGQELGLLAPPAGADDTVTVIVMEGGADQETDDQLRSRILLRIRQPPMGGDATDYVEWALSYPGVTRAWSYPLEMGIGTVTVRFMMDELRATSDPMTNGFPTPDDVAALKTYLDIVRPVAVKDFFVEAPIPLLINMQFTYLDANTTAVRNAITPSLQQVFYEKAVPGQRWYRSWLDEGINNAPGVNAYDLVAGDTDMPDSGHMAVLGNIDYAISPPSS